MDRTESVLRRRKIPEEEDEVESSNGGSFIDRQLNNNTSLNEYYGSLGDFWYDIHETPLKSLFSNVNFVRGIMEHMFFPIILLLRMGKVTESLKILASNPKLKKIHKNWKNKMHGYVGFYLLFAVCMVLGEVEKYVRADPPKPHLRGSHLLRSLSLLLPFVVYILFHAAIRLVEQWHPGILYQRQLAVPPSVLFRPHIAQQYSERDFLLSKTHKKISGYAEWEEALERDTMDAMLASAQEGKTPILTRMVGLLSHTNVRRIQQWFNEVHHHSKSGDSWNSAWNLLLALDVIHVALPILLSITEYVNGDTSVYSVLLYAGQAVASGYFWWFNLRLSLVAVMHYSRMYRMSKYMTKIIGANLQVVPAVEDAVRTNSTERCDSKLSLESPSNVSAADFTKLPSMAPPHSDADLLTADSVMDWWRFKLLMQLATAPNNQMYWLFFTCTLTADVFLCSFCVIYFSFYSQGVHLRYVMPLAVDTVAFTVMLCYVLFYSLLANVQVKKQKHALAARRLELWVNGYSWSSQVVMGLEVVHRHLDLNAHVHKLLGVLTIDTYLMIKMVGFLAGGPMSIIIRAARQMQM